VFLLQDNFWCKCAKKKYYFDEEKKFFVTRNVLLKCKHMWQIIRKRDIFILKSNCAQKRIISLFLSFLSYEILSLIATICVPLVDNFVKLPSSATTYFLNSFFHIKFIPRHLFWYLKTRRFTHSLFWSLKQNFIRIYIATSANKYFRHPPKIHRQLNKKTIILISLNLPMLMLTIYWLFIFYCPIVEGQHLFKVRKVYYFSA
jgi:hypothetical protein